MKNWKEKVRKHVPDFIKNCLPTIRTSVKVIIVLFFVIGYIHESGHALICHIDNGSFTFVSFLSFNTTCSNVLISDNFLILAFGGIFGMVGCSVILFLPKTRSDKGILIGVLVMLFKQILDFGIETFVYSIYFNLGVQVIMGLFIFLFFLFLLRFLTPNTERIS